MQFRQALRWILIGVIAVLVWIAYLYAYFGSLPVLGGSYVGVRMSVAPLFTGSPP